MTTRQEFQIIAEKRLKGIMTLYINSHYDYVCSDCGYVIEFGLKSAVCKYINVNTYPENSKEYRTHNLIKLVNLSNLLKSLEEKKKSIEFFINWSLISKWSPEFRYQPIGQNKKENADQYINSINNPKDGVFPWVKENW